MAARYCQRRSQASGVKSKHFQKLRLAQNPHAQILRLDELGTGFLAGQHKIGFIAHAAGDFAAQRFNFRLRRVARQRGQRAGQPS